MSDTPREPDASLGGAAVAQGARAQETTHDDETVPTAEEVVETLRRQLQEMEGQGAEKDKAREAAERRAADADRARQDAEQRARQADQSARDSVVQSQRSTAEAHLDAVLSALEAHNATMSSHEATYAAALAEGEFQNAAKIQREMSLLGGKITTLENGKAALEQRVKETPAEDTGRQQQQQQQQQSPYQQREAYIQRYTPKVQDWLRGPNGERFFNDPAFQRKVMGAASYAENNRGIDNNSQEYIDFIETEVGLRQPAQSADASRQQQQPAAPRGRDPDDRRMTTAPAGGSTAGSVRANADGSTNVYLTAEEKKLADYQGTSHAEWARMKAESLRDNLIGPGARR